MKIFTLPKLPLKIKEDITLGDIITAIIAFAAMAALMVSISALRETREEFNRINEPILEIDNTNLAFTASGRIIVRINTKNLSNVAAIGIAKTDTIIFVEKKQRDIFLQNPLISIDTNPLSTPNEEYYSSESKENVFSVPQPSDSIYRRFKAGDLYAFVVKYSIYKNPITEKIRVFKSVVEVFPMEQGSQQFAMGITYATFKFNYILTRNYDLPN